MTALELILLLLGAAVFAVSFIVPERKYKISEKARQELEVEIKEIIADTLKQLPDKMDEAMEDATEALMEKTERSLEKLSNEKIMAVHEYSDTVIEDINKNHKEVLFLYDMLSDKQVDLRNHVRKAEATAGEVKKILAGAQFLKDNILALQKQLEAQQHQIDEQQRALEAWQRMTAQELEQQQQLSQQQRQLEGQLEKQEEEVRQKLEQQMAAIQEAAMKEAVVREAVAREAAARAIAVKEAAAREAAEKEKAIREAAAREAAETEKAIREAAAREAAEKEREIREAAAREMPAVRKPAETPKKKQAAQTAAEEAVEDIMPALEPLKKRTAAAETADSGLPDASLGLTEQEEAVRQTKKPARRTASKKQDKLMLDMAALSMPDAGDMIQDEEQDFVELSLQEQTVPRVKPLPRAFAKQSAPVPPTQAQAMMQERRDFMSLHDIPQEEPSVIDLQERREGAGNNNDRILSLHQQGLSNIAIARELGLGVGEVKLVIDLFKGSLA